MKLISIQLPDLPILRSQSHFFCSTPPGILKGFAVRVRGKAVFLVSPRGWTPGDTEHQRAKDGPRRTFGPLEGVILQWEGEDVDGVMKYDGEPMGWTQEQIAEERERELERATAPKGKAVGR